ncbi:MULTISPECIES: AzlD domain-containing protein [unclassified Psychrobacter]|uniref:AzlD domain-containing protein n=1 Tax=unclassified Psychrobacter TaxID=196806 RepID=UPI0018F50F6C|nr:MULTISPECIES: AzlD domain-containing protein [unclassified Psychrobacter]
MTSSYLIFATLAMAAVTFVTRASPALLPKSLLDKPWLHRLNESLPLSVLVLLILGSLAIPTLSDVRASAEDTQLLLSQIGALAVVLAIYHVSRQLLVSMVAGIAAINGFIWLFANVL